ncbi:YdcF family protein [Herminiimonas sp. KBW02]|uniref:YdcF family protein n=1 Tax=Herminiimonas sp. KBW02 TaxID=2153363 RepID=UPI000F5A279F|nr:YdcF family protein [Herminiimonas sp. KBW02]RQO37083.1 YdcF family protein [Herminiimonas sp. KBW02]
MSGGWLFNAVASALLLPPFNLILLCAMGLLLRPRWPRLGVTVSVLALLILAVCSTRSGAMLFVTPLEKQNPTLQAGDTAGAQAIVVLGGSRITNAPEYGGQDIPSAISLHRLRYAASLYRSTHLPVLVSGGHPDGGSTSEASVMARVLKEDFSVPVRWLEQTSNNTAENAQLSARMLRAAGVQRILLVTDAIHMQRAQWAYQQAGLEVVAAPTIFISSAHTTPADFLPSSQGLQLSAYALHEWLGLAWYRWRHPDLAK